MSARHGMKFNVNDNVRVKLTDVGRYIHKRNHERLFAGNNSSFPYPGVPNEDADGWSTWQLWALMHEFGEDIRNGAQVPFETTIEIIVPHDALTEGAP